MYSDPDGNNPFLIMVIGYALVQADIAGNRAKNNGGNYWNGFGKSMGVSAVSMAVGFGTGALVSSFMPAITTTLATPTSSFLWGAAGGAVSGGLAGGVTNSIFGGSFKDGLISGAIGGGIMGGIGGLTNYATQHGKFVAACEANPNLPRNSDGSVNYNSPTAREYWKAYIGNEEGLNEIFTNGDGENNIVRYNTNKSSYEGKSPKGWTCGDGFTDGIDHSKLSNVYLSPNAFTSQWDLYLTMGHESIHVGDYFSGLWNPYSSLSTNKSDYRAFKWNVDQGSVKWPNGHPFHGKIVRQFYHDQYNYFKKFK